MNSNLFHIDEVCRDVVEDFDVLVTKGYSMSYANVSLHSALVGILDEFEGSIMITVHPEPLCDDIIYRVAEDTYEMHLKDEFTTRIWNLSRKELVAYYHEKYDEDYKLWHLKFHSIRV